MSKAFSQYTDYVQPKIGYLITSTYNYFAIQSYTLTSLQFQGF